MKLIQYKDKIIIKQLKHRHLLVDSSQIYFAVIMEIHQFQDPETDLSPDQKILIPLSFIFMEEVSSQ